jgi:alkaline phosphatase D
VTFGAKYPALTDVDNRDLWSVDIAPQPQARPAVVAQHS